MSETSEVCGYKVHPAADVFPLITGEEFRRFVEDVHKNGLRDPIVMIGDRILDGRNRVRACVELGVPLRFKHYEDDDPIGFVVSANLDGRRHLTAAQRAMAAARIATLRAGNPGSSNASIEAIRQNEAAAQLNVGRASVQRARSVLTDAIPEVVAAVDAGQLAVSAAAELAGLPEEEQQRIMEESEGNMRSVRALVRNAGGHAPAYTGAGFEAKVRTLADSGFSAETIAGQLGRQVSEVAAVIGPVGSAANKDTGPRPSRNEAVAALDEKIIAIYQGDGRGSPKLTAEFADVTATRVHQALNRAGLNTAAIAAKDPLRNLINGLNATAASWRELVNIAPWSEATREQRDELLSALKTVLSRGRAIAKSVESERGNEERVSA